jgi:FkbM family methyltransferase
MLPPVTIYTNNDDIKYAMFDVNEVISDEIRKNGCWNYPAIDICDKVLAVADQGSRVIDVGAGLGSFTVPLAIKYANKHIFSAFEPIHPLFLQLCTNTLLNNLDNVKNYNTALSNFNDTVDAPILEINSCGNHGSYSFVKNINDLRNMAPSAKTDVYEFRTLDSYRFAKVGVIKVSAPGMELEVLTGANETISMSKHPPVIFEAWSNEWYKYQKEAIIDFFQKHGYEHYCFMGEHIMAFKTYAQWNDCINGGAQSLQSTPTNQTAVDAANTTQTSSSFKISEQHHDTKAVLQNQVVLR